MGYWSANKHNTETYKEWATKKYSFESCDIKHTVLDVALVNFNEVYIACERLTKSNGVKYVYCLVVLMRKDRYEWMTKEMDETMGPYYYNCPMRIFNMLSPIRKMRVTGDAFRCSREWRETVIERHHKKAVIKNLVYGKNIKFNRLINFRDKGVDIKFDTFTVIDQKNMIFRAVGPGGFLVTLNNQFMRNNTWKIVN